MAKRLYLRDIDPRKWYTCSYARDINGVKMAWPFQFVCTESPGVQRGHVNLDFNTSSPTCKIVMFGTGISSTVYLKIANISEGYFVENFRELDCEKFEADLKILNEKLQCKVDELQYIIASNRTWSSRKNSSAIFKPLEL